MSTVTAVPIQPTRRRVLVFLWAGIVIAIAAAGWLAFHGTAGVIANAPGGTDEAFLAWNKSQPGVVETASGLQYQVLKQGDGTSHPTANDVALVTYVGHLRDGKVFDASQQPVPFPLSGGAIPGFLEGVKLMTKGARYRFWMKPDLAYGDRSPDPSRIPNGAMLVFDVDLVDFVSQQIFQQIQMQQMMQQQQMQQQRGGAAVPPPAGAPAP